jgi:REP element-mobilizing transposase RayT
MPGRNILKQDVAESYYHIYARGVNKRKIFLDDTDFTYFLSLLKRYLSQEDSRTSRGAQFAKLYDDINLLAYCLMSNHFHLLVFQINEKAMTKLMRGVMSSYSMYFNKKYGRTGHLFESRYRASRISNDQYFAHISRYIHFNPKEWRHYRYSSLSSYLDGVHRDWVLTQRIMDLYSSTEKYLEFLQDYEEKRDQLQIIKDEIANTL